MEEGGYSDLTSGFIMGYSGEAKTAQWTLGDVTQYLLVCLLTYPIVDVHAASGFTTSSQTDLDCYTYAPSTQHANYNLEILRFLPHSGPCAKKKVKCLWNHFHAPKVRRASNASACRVGVFTVSRSHFFYRGIRQESEILIGNARH